MKSRQILDSPLVADASLCIGNRAPDDVDAMPEPRVSLAKRLWERAENLNGLCEGKGYELESVRVPKKFLLIEASLFTEAAGRLEGYEARIHDFEHQALELNSHLLNFAASVGAEEGQDMLELLYGFFGRIRCECGHPADEHHMVEIAAEKQCGHSDPNHGFCDCNGLRLVLYSEGLPNV